MKIVDLSDYGLADTLISIEAVSFLSKGEEPYRIPDNRFEYKPLLKFVCAGALVVIAFKTGEEEKRDACFNFIKEQITC